MNQKAQIIPEQLINIDKVVEFAKQNGFPDATVLYWDTDNPEHGETDIGMVMNYRDPGDVVEVSLGIALTKDGIKAMITKDEDDEDEWWCWMV